jgi:hypothetical protein
VGGEEEVALQARLGTWVWSGVEAIMYSNRMCAAGCVS